MYFEDLTPYEYSPETKQRARRVDSLDPRNVGWLQPPFSFPLGSFEPVLLQKLASLSVLAPIAQMRGFHHCELCEQEDVVVELEGRKRVLGSAEIWVPSVGSGLVYAAPNLIVHYIAEHHYLPPTEFTSALEQLDVEQESNRDLWRRLSPSLHPDSAR